MIKIFIRDINKGHKRDILGTKSVLRDTIFHGCVTLGDRMWVIKPLA